MDDNSGNSSDKRNWRERLGIGKTTSAGDMPKLAADFKPIEPEASKAVQPPNKADKPAESKPAPYAPVKAAPMAPRTGTKSIVKEPLGTPSLAPKPAVAAPLSVAPVNVTQSRPSALRTPPLPTDALAKKLKDQRDAAERLALQRVQAAKNKAEVNLNAGGATTKPKFSFADESAQSNLAGSASPQSARPAASPNHGAMPAQPGAFPSHQIQPPRPQLGGGGFGPPPNFAPQGQGYVPQSGLQQKPFQPNYGFQQPPPYRPIEPNTNYAPPPSQLYMPPPMRQPSQTTMAQPAQRRPTVPTRAVAPEGRAPSAPRGPQVALGPTIGRSNASDDVFEPAPVRATGRRATANEYRQAYRDELGYEQEAPRSRILITLLSFLALGLLVAFAAVYGYAHYFKNLRATSTSNAVPVVSAPATPTKVTPETPNQTDTASKKQIYDRIEGDHEVPGGLLKPSEEIPSIQPGAAKAITPPGQTPNAAGATEGVPLPLPPPPGGGTGQQGSLAPNDKTDVSNITPAAEPSSAANSSSAPPDVPLRPDQTSVIPASTQAALPMPEPPGSTPPPEAPSGTAHTVSPDLAKPAVEAILPLKPTSNQPTPLATGTPQNEPLQTPVKKVDRLKKLVLAKSLGAKPVILVPPAKPLEKNRVNLESVPALPIAATGGNSLYGAGPTQTVSAPTQVVSAPPPKAAASINLNPTPKIALSTPAQPTPAGTGYVAQLASFNSKTEANAEYQRLSVKHGTIISRYAPIIIQAQIAGATRYKLNLGPMATNDAALSVCSALISAGERDCVVRRQ